MINLSGIPFKAEVTAGDYSTAAALTLRTPEGAITLGNGDSFCIVDVILVTTASNKITLFFDDDDDGSLDDGELIAHLTPAANGGIAHQFGVPIFGNSIRVISGTTYGRLKLLSAASDDVEGVVTGLLCQRFRA